LAGQQLGFDKSLKKMLAGQIAKKINGMQILSWLARSAQTNVLKPASGALGEKSFL